MLEFVHSRQENQRNPIEPVGQSGALWGKNRAAWPLPLLSLKCNWCRSPDLPSDRWVHNSWCVYVDLWWTVGDQFVRKAVGPFVLKIPPIEPLVEASTDMDQKYTNCAALMMLKYVENLTQLGVLQKLRRAFIKITIAPDFFKATASDV